MKEFLAQNGGLLGAIVLVAVCLNLVLSGIAKMLDLIKDKTKTEVDNKIAAILHKVIAVLQKVIDWGSGNREHK